jgi:hypothetical protein
MEARFAQDFSGVRVHADEAAAAAAAALGADAWTFGPRMVFAGGRFRPETPHGRRLLAHELAHVVQQQAGPTAVQGSPALSGPADPAERAADAAAGAAAQADAPDRSTALRLRERLRAARPTRPTVQRQVKTWAGEFDTDKYETVKNVAKDSIGVDIELRFKPGDRVFARKIGMVQTVISKSEGKVVFPGASATIKARSIPAGKAGEGANIDRLESRRSPVYGTGVAGAKATIANVPMTATGQYGWRYTDQAGKLQKRDALLKDAPSIDPPGKNSSQTFETTALAVAGAQVGTYYGSVQWGWQTDAAGTFTKLPLTLVSKDVPSATFAEAAELWNVTPTSTGEATIALPIAIGKFTNTPGVWLVRDPGNASASIVRKLAKNTRVEVIDKGAARPFNVGAAAQWWKVTVVDTTTRGRVGWVLESVLSDAKS